MSRDVAERTGSDDTDRAAPLGEWRPHRVTAFLVRVLVLAVPIIAAIVATILLIQVVPAPRDLGWRIAWWIGLAVVATVVARTTARAMRRLLPLAALLRLTLVFPDQVPSRMAVALRVGTVRQLRDRIDAVHAVDGETPEVLGARELLALVGALNAHDRLTRGHSERVRALADLLADELELPDDDRAKVRWAALLHDIGKLAVPAEVLNKRTEPTDDEWSLIRIHPTAGAQLLHGALAEWLGEWGWVWPSTTRSGTARDIHAGWREPRSRSPAGSSPSSTRSRS